MSVTVRLTRQILAAPLLFLGILCVTVADKIAPYQNDGAYRDR